MVVNQLSGENRCREERKRSDRRRGRGIDDKNRKYIEVDEESTGKNLM